MHLDKFEQSIWNENKVFSTNVCLHSLALTKSLPMTRYTGTSQLGLVSGGTSFVVLE